MNTPESITLLRTQSLTTLVHEELERQIASGRLLPGIPLREASIAMEMGISRGPVREAFRLLEERGLVKFEKNCGVRVRQLNLDQAAQIYQVRIPLEVLTGQLVIHNRTDALLGELRENLKSMAAKVGEHDVSGYTALNFQFHDLLVKHTGNRALYDTYRRLVVQLQLFRSYTFRHDPQTIAISYQEHVKIAEAIDLGDAALASELLGRHAQESLNRLNHSAGQPE